MSDPTQSCPTAWRLFTTPQRSCGKFGGPQCNGVTYDTGSTPYTRVCGRILATPLSTVQVFRGGQRDINTFYLDGVSVTHGSPHVWSFVAGAATESSASFRCPCDNGNPAVPSFVESNYFCEGPPDFSDTQTVLWDGMGCSPFSTCCSFNSPLWFTATLPAPTADDIEVRICSGETSVGGFNNENTSISLMEIFVQ